MVKITTENIIRIANGDIIIKGDPVEIVKSVYEDGWFVSENLRGTEELEVEKSGHVSDFAPGLTIKLKLPYNDFTDGNWFSLEDAELIRN